MALLMHERPSDGRLFVWDDGTAGTLPPGNDDADREFLAALEKPASLETAVRGVDDLGVEVIVEAVVELEPGSADHARAVMRELGATAVIVDVD